MIDHTQDGDAHTNTLTIRIEKCEKCDRSDTETTREQETGSCHLKYKIIIIYIQISRYSEGRI